MIMRFVLILASLLVITVAEENEKKEPGRCDLPSSMGDTGCHNIPEIMELETTKCQPYHVFVIRGTDENPAPGRLGNLTRQVCDEFGGKEHCGWENVDYPAKSRFVTDTSYCESSDIGAENGQKQIQHYVDSCPDTKLILLGLSQGASIVQDILGGGGGPVFKCTQQPNPPLDPLTSPGKNIAAALSFGSPRRASGASYAVKSGKGFTSVSERNDEQRAALEKWARVLSDYCNDGDYMCADGSHERDMDKHTSYMVTYSEEVLDWIVQKVDNRRRSHTLLYHFANNKSWLLGTLMCSMVVMCTAIFCFACVRRSCLAWLSRKLVREPL